MTWRPSSIIVCDDIRVEMDGKQILVGVYAGDIIFPSFPARMNQLLFRVEVIAYNEPHKTLSFRIMNNSGDVLMNLDGDAPPEHPSENSVFVFALHQPVFSREEKYTVEFGFDGVLKNIGEFRVRLPHNSLELEKAASKPLA